MKLDYTPLTSPVTDEDRAAYAAAQYPMERTSGKVFALIAIGLIVMGFVVYTGFLGEWLLGLIYGGMILVFLLAAYFFGTAKSRKERKYRPMLFKFAQANKLHYSVDTIPDSQKGMFFVVGDYAEILDKFVFPDGVEVGNLASVTGSGKSSFVYQVAYIRLTLKRNLPHLLLDAKVNDYYQLSGNAFASLKGVQRLALEGDFNKYFSLYVPPGYERDALYIFTPDVMATLVDHGAAYDIEIVDDELYIYHPGYIDLANASALEAFLSASKVINREVLDQSRRYADARIGDRTRNTVHADGQRTVTPGSHRESLKVPLLLGIFAIGCMLVVAYATMGW